MAVVIGIGNFKDSTENQHCWMCKKILPVREVFCHNCDSIQKMNKADYFARLNIEKTLDVDVDLLEKHYAALSKALNPEKFQLRGITERKYAAQHLEALNEAYQTLKDPLKRGKYWMDLHEKVFDDDEEYQELPSIQELKEDLSNASKPSECDLAARKACQSLEHAIVVFMQALRGSAWRNANSALKHISSLEEVLNSVRTKRNAL